MIGIFGGTFDPIHFGHLRTALDVQQALDLDEVRIIPLRDPPHRDQPETTTRQRLAMIRAAVTDEPAFRLDTRELEREGKSYSVETLRSLREELGDTTPICLIVGSDAFHGFPAWHKPAEILQLAHIIVMQRPGDPLPELYPERLTQSIAALRTTPAGCIYPQQVTQLQISATRIRTLIKAGLSPRYLLPDGVLEIIRQEKLYLEEC
jgi:nicotinate-nucleotide adenylyltransferase